MTAYQNNPRVREFLVLTDVLALIPCTESYEVIEDCYPDVVSMQEVQNYLEYNEKLGLEEEPEVKTDLSDSN